MYSLVSAIGRLVGTNQRWESLEIGDIACSTLYTNYSRVYAILSNPFITTQVCLDLETLRGTLAGNSETFSAFLTANADKTLTTSTSLPTLSPVYVKYSDAIRAGYTIKPIKFGTAVDADVPEEQKTSLQLSQSGIDFASFKKYMMASVNGFFHYMDGDGTVSYVLDGMSSVKKCKQAVMGLYSFRELGELTYMKMTSNMLYLQNSNQTWANETYVDLGVDISQKTVILVIGGYMNVLDDRTFFKVSNTGFKIDWTNYPLLERYFEALPYLNMKPLGLNGSDKNPTQIAVSGLTSQAGITALLTKLPQSFVVLLDNDDVYKERVFVQSLPEPGRYVSYIKPWYPLFNGVGKVNEYWSVDEIERWGINVLDNYRHHRWFSTVSYDELDNVTDQRIPNRRFTYSPAFMLKLGSELAWTTAS